MDVGCVVQDIEDAIRHLTQTDCETNLNVIKSLEEASYKLWVESNTAFLDESFLSTCTQEDSWIWDEECFFDEASPDDLWSLDGSVCITDLTSSLEMSISGDDSFCSLGYQGDTESNATFTEFTETETKCRIRKNQTATRRTVRRKRKSKTEHKRNESCAQVEITSEEVLNENDLDDDWVIVDETDRKCDQFQIPSVSTDSLHAKVVPDSEAEEEFDTTLEDEEDWTVLSLKITEVKTNSVRSKYVPSRPDFNMSRDSGITSPDVNCAWTRDHPLTADGSYRMHVPYR